MMAKGDSDINFSIYGHHPMRNRTPPTKVHKWQRCHLAIDYCLLSVLSTYTWACPSCSTAKHFPWGMGSPWTWTYANANCQGSFFSAHLTDDLISIPHQKLRKKLSNCRWWLFVVDFTSRIDRFQILFILNISNSSGWNVTVVLSGLLMVSCWVTTA